MYVLQPPLKRVRVFSLDRVLPSAPSTQDHVVLCTIGNVSASVLHAALGLTTTAAWIFPPANGPREGLEPDSGVVLLKLNPVTKASQTRQADLVLSFITWSKFEYGVWMQRLLDFGNTFILQLQYFCFIWKNGRLEKRTF